MSIEDLDPWFFPMPSNSCSIQPGSNLDFMNSAYRVVLSSPVVISFELDYDILALHMFHMFCADFNCLNKCVYLELIAPELI